MKVSDRCANGALPMGQSVDAMAVMAALRLVGADKYDPVRFHYLEVLQKRANAHQGQVKHLLNETLAQGLVTLRARFEHAQSAARGSIDHMVSKYPQALPDLNRLFLASDFKGVQSFIVSLEKSRTGESLGDLSRQLAQRAAETLDGSFDGDVGLRPELKTAQSFRNTWSKLSVEKRVMQALDQAPKNAGPINSHMLVVRSLALMRDISPDYLNRFTTYVDTLLCLEQCLEDKKGKPRKTAEGDADKKPRSRRSPSR